MEIDDIFNKPKASALTLEPNQTPQKASTDSLLKKKKKTKQKQKLTNAKNSNSKWAEATVHDVQDEIINPLVVEYIENATIKIIQRPKDDNGFGDTRGRRKTDDGLHIYTDKELRIGEGEGDTPDCPFDCWCCY